MRDLMFEVPSDNMITDIVVEKECVTDEVLPTVKRSTEQIA